MIRSYDLGITSLPTPIAWMAQHWSTIRDCPFTNKCLQSNNVPNAAAVNLCIWEFFKTSQSVWLIAFLNLKSEVETVSGFTDGRVAAPDRRRKEGTCPGRVPDHWKHRAGERGNRHSGRRKLKVKKLWSVICSPPRVPRCTYRLYNSTLLKLSTESFHSVAKSGQSQKHFRL